MEHLIVIHNRPTCVCSGVSVWEMLRREAMKLEAAIILFCETDDMWQLMSDRPVAHMWMWEWMTDSVPLCDECVCVNDKGLIKDTELHRALWPRWSCICHTHIDSQILKRTHTLTYTTHTQTHSLSHAHIHTDTHTHPLTHPYTHKHTHARTHTYVHKHTHAHTHTFMFMGLLWHIPCCESAIGHRLSRPAVIGR